MNMNCQPLLSQVTHWDAARLAPPPRGSGPPAVRLGSAAPASLGARRLVEALKRMWFGGPPGSGGSEPPSERQSTGDSIWQDPVLWMLMMH